MAPSKLPNKSVMLRVPCCYQGGKQRIASQVVDYLLSHPLSQLEKTTYYDLCCGSGAITIELINRGIDPKRIVMVDLSSWGAFWEKVGSGNYDLTKLKHLIDEIPGDKKRVKAHVSAMAKQPVSDDEAYIYPILQACSTVASKFGSITKNGKMPSSVTIGSRPPQAKEEAQLTPCNHRRRPYIEELNPL